MAKITFERFLRDCGHNDDRLKGFSEKRGLIYDYNVLIDGEHRATLYRIMFGRGFGLYDADRRPMKFDWRNVFEIANKADFKPVITQLLAEGKIPTLSRMAQLRAEEAAKAEAKAREEAEQQRVHRIQQAALALYEAAKAVEGSPDCARAVREYTMIRDAIAKAEGVGR